MSEIWPIWVKKHWNWAKILHFGWKCIKKSAIHDAYTSKICVKNTKNNQKWPKNTQNWVKLSKFDANWSKITIFLTILHRQKQLKNNQFQPKTTNLEEKSPNFSQFGRKKKKKFPHRGYFFRTKAQNWKFWAYKYVQHYTTLPRGIGGSTKNVRTYVHSSLPLFYTNIV